MRRVLLGLVLLLLAGLVASPVEANPFAGKPSAEPAPPPAAPGIFRSVLVRVGQVQRELNATLSRQLRAIKETGSVGAALAVAGVAFAYGVLHAAGPGHGKLVVSSLFLGRDATIPAVFLVGSFVSLLQTLSAIAIVGVYGLVLHRGGLDALQGAARFEVVSYALVVLIGLYMLWAVLRGHAHHAHAAGGSGPAREDRQPRSTRAIVIATGLTPCASALILMIFALANGVFLVGIGAALVMAVGMSLTVAVAGLLGMTARAGVLRSMAVSARAVERVRTGLSLAGALMITGIGFLFLASAWTRLQ
jgi:nickel/cobalt transporter (NicO) family protein